MKSIFIFRRDLTTYDNIGFIECIKNSKEILPIFIFTPEQTINNKYFSSNAFQFMIESLKSLNNELELKYKIKLHYFYDNNIKVLSKLFQEYKYDAIYFNMDYTEYACKRDDEINTFSKKYNIKCIITESYLLNKIGTYLKSDGTEYQKFTPFKNYAIKIKVPKPITNIIHKNPIKTMSKIKSSKPLDKILDKIFHKNKNKNIFLSNPNIKLHGGRIYALNILKKIIEYKNYDKIRNILIKNTTNLSPYIKFGCVSIREVYHIISSKLGTKNGLISQLLWREFYYYIGYYNKYIFKGKSLKKQYNGIKWKNDKSLLKKWKNGTTGFPIVDAGMRELNETGFMHNRARLITSNILIKILNIDWRWGELYFAKKLIDYDPAVNNGNWQWSSGSGVDSQPYFRIFSVELQTKRFDPECLYIKKWIPELKDVPNKDIINWINIYNKYPNIKYPKPIVDYKKMRQTILQTYKKGLYK